LSALRLFEPTGWSALQSWIGLWNAASVIQLSADKGAVLRELAGGDLVLRATLAWSGSVHGRCDIYVAASALTPPRGRDVAGVLDVLAEVPVDVRVELGTLRMSLEEVRQLRPGATLALSTFVDERLPIYVGGVLKAWGKPVVHRGVLAISVEQVLGERGGRA
jgi:flagellar motor switch/type III secretory pathway protein FliN